MSNENVSIPARLAYATTLRHLAAGLISIGEHDAAYFRISKFYGNDAAVDAIWETVVETCSAFYDGKLRGRHAWSRETKRYAAQCILLLRSSKRHEPCTWSARENRDQATGLPLVARLSISIAWLAFVLAPIVLLCSGFTFTALLAVFGWFVYGLTLAISHELRSRRHAAFRFTLPFDIVSSWPFASRESISAARQHPTYLCGVRSVSLAS